MKSAVEIHRTFFVAYYLVFSTRARNFCPGLNVTTRRAETGTTSPVFWVTPWAR